MTAVLIPAATEQEWLDARRQGITASEITVVMGLSPYSSPYALYHQKLGVLPPQDETDAMALGRHMESYVAAKFAERHNDRFFVSGNGRELYAPPDRSWQMATPDRLVYELCGCGPGYFCEMGHEPLAVLECKIDGGSDEWGGDGTGQVPVHYRAQVLWQMDVMGVGTGYVACLLWNKRQVRVYELAMDAEAEADLKLMREEGWAFLRRLYARDEPDIDWRPATAGALKRLHPDVEDRDVAVPRYLARQYRAACRAVKDAERRRDLAANRIRGRLGNGHRAVEAGVYVPDGKGRLVACPVARRDVYDVKPYQVKGFHVDKLVPVKTPGAGEEPCGS